MARRTNKSRGSYWFSSGDDGGAAPLGRWPKFLAPPMPVIPDVPVFVYVPVGASTKSAAVHNGALTIHELDSILKCVSATPLAQLLDRTRQRFPSEPEIPSVEDKITQLPSFPSQPVPPPSVSKTDPGPEPNEQQFFPKVPWWKVWSTPYSDAKSRGAYTAARGLWEWAAMEYSDACKKQKELDEKFAIELSEWDAAQKQWVADIERYKIDLASHYRLKFSETVNVWRARKEAFDAAVLEDLRHLVEITLGYESEVPASVCDLIRLALLASKYPRSFPRDLSLSFDPGGGILLIEIVLPNLRDEDIGEYRSSGAFEQRFKPIAEAKRSKVAHRAYCSVMIRTLCEAVSADYRGLCRGVAVNGKMTFIDRATGQSRTEVIASVFALREAILELNPVDVDPVICFRALKGLMAPPSDVFTPVPPVMVLNRDDRRIVAGKDVIGGMARQTNLAAMEWEDFEHLVRQLFEKEFAVSTGAEVRVTRASRDYGVDAIVFDPDPIRGGKYVIQAKRYTNPVDVAAVRDLYGTLVNEGAVKGLLVTTSHFGPESYEFAKDKPITLIDGSNLLSLFNRHGFEFSIDIEAARSLGRT
jgi:restriction system protein